jgi:hypothetical protein
MEMLIAFAGGGGWEGADLGGVEPGPTKLV